MPIRLFVDPEIWRSWDHSSSEHHDLGEDLRLRPLEMWRRAQTLLRRDVPPVIRSEAIAALERAIRHRIVWLYGLYNLKKLPLRSKPRQSFDLLVHLGLLRPQLPERLNAILSTITRTPPFTVCEELLGFTWSFLWATNGYVRRQVQAFTLEPVGQGTGGPLGLRVEALEGRQWKFKVSGFVPARLVSERARSGWVALAATRAHRRRQALASAHAGARPQDLYVEGRFIGPETLMHELACTYFDVGSARGDQPAVEPGRRVLAFQPRRGGLVNSSSDGLEPAWTSSRLRTITPSLWNRPQTVTPATCRTGLPCPTTARWRTADACRTTAEPIAGEALPRCPRCHRNVTWLLDDVVGPRRRQAF